MTAQNVAPGRIAGEGASRRAQPALSSALATLLDGCHDCGRAMKLPAELKDRVIASIRRTPSPVRSQARREARRVLLATLAVSAVLFFAADGVHHALGRPPWAVAASVVVWGAVALVSLRAAWRGGVSFGAGSLTSLAIVTVSAPAVLLAAHLAFVRIAPDLARLHSERLGLNCFALTLAAAACPLAGLSMARRSSDPLHPMASGAALGVACAALGGVMVALWCPVAAPRHVLVGHILPMGVLALLGATLGARVIAMRSGARLSA